MNNMQGEFDFNRPVTPGVALFQFPFFSHPVPCLSGYKSAASKTGNTPETYWRNRDVFGLLFCHVCRDWKAKEEFAYGTRGLFRTRCRTCHPLFTRANRYGLTVPQMLELLKNPCGICGRAGAKMHIDHCHETGKVRGVLCARCNTAIGKLLECELLFHLAIAYIKKHKVALIEDEDDSADQWKISL